MNGDVTAVPLADGCADVVAAGEVLEHVPDWRRALAEACRLLRPGGLLVLDTLNDTVLSRVVAVHVGERLPTVPRGIHDPRLFVDARALVAEAARHGVALRLRGVRPEVRGLLGWLFRRVRGASGAAPAGRAPRIVPTRSTAVLYQGWGSERIVRARRGKDAEEGAQVTVHALEAARRLAPRFAARAAEHDRDGSFPAEDFEDLREAGLFGLMVPRDLGGFGATFAEYAAVATELAKGNGATALVFNMHASVTGALGAVTEELAEALGVPDEALAARDRLLRAAADGAWYAVAMSERGAGARLSQLSTVYEPVEGGWHIKGSKTFCSGAGHPDGYLVAARSAADQSVVSQFLVPAGDGITVEPTWDSLGMRATASHDLHLDVTVPADRLLGGVEGLALVVAQLMPHWLVASYAAVYVGWPGRRSRRRPST